MSDLILTSDHEYFVRGERYPGVTEILAGLGLGRDWQFLKDRDFYLQRGSAVHACIKLHFEGSEIDWNFEGSEHVRPRFERFLELAAAAGLKPIVFEKPMASETFRYAGTEDYFGPYLDHPVALIDFKGDNYEPAHDLQLGGYRGLLVEAATRGEIAVQPADVMFAPAFVVPLGGGAPVRIKDYEGADIDLFRACAAAYNWKLANYGGSR